MPSPLSKNLVAADRFSRTTLSRFMMSALLVIVAAGCSNNAADATSNSSVVNAATTKVSSAKVAADNDPAVVEALQTNLTASGIEERIVSAVPTDMDGIYWVTAEGLPSFFTDKSGKHIIQGQIIAVGEAQPVDISAALTAKTAQEALKTVDKKEMIIYPAKGETKSVI
ncbi:MAG: disulfide isomerase DsbC N-terminal domain-containing protein, partial [Psychrobacter alimentarius]